MITLPTLRTALSLALTGAVLALHEPALASGGDGFEENAFTPEFHVPAAERANFARGDLAVMPASYWRVYQFLSWRALTGHALSQDEVKTLGIDGWEVRGPAAGTTASTAAAPDTAIGTWLKARDQVTGARDVEVDSNTEIAEFDMILNCPDDAFARAAATLNQRLKQGGQQWAAVWLANQDAVFANCSPRLTPETRKLPLPQRQMTMPPALPAKAPEWLVKDHAYQSAAALFYAGRYDDARDRFLAIGQDAKSPWQPLGNYLAARCLLRKSALLPSVAERRADLKAIADLLAKARAELVAASASYPPARGLIGWVDFRLRPEERRVELSNVLSTAKVDGDVPPKLSDYLYLLDRMTPEQMMAAADPMTAWIGMMQASAGDRYGDRSSDELKKRRRAAFELARAKWKQKHETVWLIAMLTNAGKDDVGADDLQAAAAIHEGTPGFGAAQYQLARLEIAAQHLRDADAIVSAMLKRTLPTYVRNRWLRMKMVTAQSADEFLAAAPRTPAENEQGTPIPDEGKPADKAVAMVDADLQTHLAHDFPLAVLKALRSRVPAERRQWLADLIWTRAVLLEDFATADALVDEVAASRDTTRGLYERYRKAANPQDKRDAAMLILANTPELVPAVQGTKSSRGYEGAEYWSCGYRSSSPDEFDTIAPAFLSKEERALAEREQAQLRSIPKRSAYLIPRVIDWAKAHRDDADGPKALHFLVASTRNECSAGAEVPGEKRNYSKEAFQVLHSVFPKSPWTAKTKYYY
jgi:hypothetical protein